MSLPPSQYPFSHYAWLLSCLRATFNFLQNNPYFSSPWWHYVTTDFNEDTDTIPKDSLFPQVINDLLWYKFSSTSYRKLATSTSSYAITSIPGTFLVNHFWSIPMLLPARDFWFRILCRKYFMIYTFKKLIIVRIPIIRCVLSTLK